MNVYFIGGSPCSGKSTAAGALAETYGLAYFKADDYLEEFTARGAAAGLPVCREIQRMTAEETWMRPPQVQCREELDYYREVFPFVMEKLAALSAPCILAEGAAFLPDLMQAHGIGADRRQRLPGKAAGTDRRTFPFEQLSMSRTGKSILALFFRANP